MGTQPLVAEGVLGWKVVGMPGVQRPRTHGSGWQGIPLTYPPSCAGDRDPMPFTAWPPAAARDVLLIPAVAPGGWYPMKTKEPEFRLWVCGPTWVRTDL